MPSDFPTPELGGPLWKRVYSPPPEFPMVTGPRYADGGQDTFLSFTTPTRRWVIDYDVLSEIEVQVLDDHYEEAQGQHLGFDFTDPETGVTYTGVKYERFERPAHELVWVQSRSIQLVKRP